MRAGHPRKKTRKDLQREIKDMEEDVQVTRQALFGDGAER